MTRSKPKGRWLDATSQRQPRHADLLSALHALRKREARVNSTVEAAQRLAMRHDSPDVRREATLPLIAWQKQWRAERDSSPRIVPGAPEQS